MKDRKSCEELRQQLGIDSESNVIRRSRLRWFDHVERNDDGDWVKACQRLEARQRQEDVERMCCTGHEGIWIRGA